MQTCRYCKRKPHWYIELDWNCVHSHALVCTKHLFLGIKNALSCPDAAKCLVSEFNG